MSKSESFNAEMEKGHFERWLLFPTSPSTIKKMDQESVMWVENGGH